MESQFDLLDSFFNSKEEPEVVEDECEHEFINDNYHEVCKLCGLCRENNELLYQDTVVTGEYNEITREHFAIRTYVKGSSYNIKRLQTWSNSSNKENFLRDCFFKIKDIFDKHGVSKSYIDAVSKMINDYYVFKEMRIRGHIKTGRFIYLLFHLYQREDRPLDILKIIRDSGITIYHYNKSVKLMRDTDDSLTSLYIPEDIYKLKKQLKKLMIIYTDISFIKDYNRELLDVKRVRKKNIAKITILKNVDIKYYEYIKNNFDSYFDINKKIYTPFMRDDE